MDGLFDMEVLGCEFEGYGVEVLGLCDDVDVIRLVDCGVWRNDVLIDVGVVVVELEVC